MPATLDETGITIPTQQEIKDEIDADLHAEFGANLNTTTGFLGKFNAMMAEKFRKAYELLLDTYSNAFADRAIGEPLAALAALTGTVRRGGSPSQVMCTLELDDGTYAAGTLVAYVSGDPDALFENRDEIIVSGGGNPETVTNVIFVAQSDGPTVANAGTLTETSTVVTGWSDNPTPITNSGDAVLGELEEGDEDLRARRLIELARPGTGTVPAIRADVSDITGVEQVIVLENDEDDMDEEGLPGHSIEVIVYDGTTADDVTHTVADDDIAQVIWDNKPAGTYAHGDETGTAENEDGDDITIHFSRPLSVTIYMEIDLEVDADTYGGDAAVKTAVIELAQEIQTLGEDVFASRYYEAVHSVDGVINVTRLEVAAVTPTAGAIDVAIGYRELADIDTSNIDVTS